MKVIGISGSARKDGNTALIIRAVFEELEAEGIRTEANGRLPRLLRLQRQGGLSLQG